MANEQAGVNTDSAFLVKINRLIEAILKPSPSFSTDKVQLRYDLPEKGERTPDKPTLCVYLHSMSENTRLRNGNTSQWEQTPYRSDSTSRILPGYVNVSCNYLLIFWDDAKITRSDPGNQSATFLSEVITSLLAAQYIDNVHDAFGIDFPQFSGHFIQDSEKLESLSNFWQSLDMQPRMCLNYEITVPVAISPRTPPTPLTVVKPAPVLMLDEKEKAQQEAEAVQKHLEDDAAKKAAQKQRDDDAAKKAAQKKREEEAAAKKLNPETPAKPTTRKKS